MDPSSHDIKNERVLFIRLPCNPIFPIGPIYLADHLHKCFPNIPQKILGAVVHGRFSSRNQKIVSKNMANLI